MSVYGLMRTGASDAVVANGTTGLVPIDVKQAGPTAAATTTGALTTNLPSAAAAGVVNGLSAAGSLVLALVAAVDSGAANLNADAFSALTNKPAQAAGEAGSDVAGMESNRSIAQARLAKASERISLRQNFLERRIGEAESVDAAKAAMNLSTSTLQLEASDAVTARLQKLSLPNDLPVT